MHNNLLLAQPSDEKLYVEDVFSTWLYTGNGTTNTITNGIDLSGKGGLVWLKARANETYGGNVFVDTSRGRASLIASSSTPTTNAADAALTSPINTDLASFNSNGFTLGSDNWFNKNTNGQPYASWTFRKAPKFFDVVTFTYAPTAYPGKSITHNLGSTPGMIIVKSTTLGTGGGASWYVSHRATPNPYVDDLYLNSTAAASSNNGSINGVTSTAFNFIGGGTAGVTQTYVAYLFAHDTTADGVIQCGSYVGNASTAGPEINLGWEPQFVLIKNINNQYGHWHIFDTMRGMSASTDADLLANNSANENYMFGSVNWIEPTATGFRITATSADVNNVGVNHIYLAIRRGPMRVPTDATKVYSGVLTTPASSTTTAFSPDLAIVRPRSGGQNNLWFDRMRGPLYWIRSDGSTAEVSQANSLTSFGQNGVALGSFWSGVGSTIVQHFKRATGFFDIVNIRSNGTGNQTISHNLGVVPEMIITKNRTNIGGSVYAAWWVAHNGMPGWNTGNQNDRHAARLEQTVASGQQGYHLDLTSTTFRLVSAPIGYTSGENIIAYLFASCPGVSKVGSYTGNGSSLNIDCGFTNGARFVLIKRTDSTGDWFTFDTARGIVTANDPHLSLNTTAAEVTTNDSIDPLSSGFTVNQNATTNINVSGGTYIYLAIA